MTDGADAQVAAAHRERGREPSAGAPAGHHDPARFDAEFSGPEQRLIQPVQAVQQPSGEGMFRRQPVVGRDDDITLPNPGRDAPGLVLGTAHDVPAAVGPQQRGPRPVGRVARRVHVQAERGNLRPTIHNELVVTHVFRNAGWPAHRLPDGRYRVLPDPGRLEGQGRTRHRGPRLRGLCAELAPPRRRLSRLPRHRHGASSRSSRLGRR
jgi:hypothetical protein